MSPKRFPENNWKIAASVLYCKKSFDCQVRIMKQNFLHRYPSLLAAAPGLACALLRTGLYALEEPSGLLPRSHPLHIATLVIALVTAAAVVRFVLPLKGPGEYAPNFPADRLAVTGSCFAALWLLPAAFAIWEQSFDRLGLACAVLAFAAVPCLVCIGVFRFTHRRPSFLLHCGLCLFFAVHMICQYRVWSSNPQTADYLFGLLACVFLTLAAYYRAGFDLDAGKRRKLLLCGLLAGFFCICSLAGEGEKHFYLSGALWSLTDLCAVAPMQQEEQADVSA